MSGELELYLFKTLVFPKKKNVRFVKPKVLVDIPKRIQSFEPESSFDFHNVIHCFVNQDEKDTIFVGMDSNGCKYFDLNTRTKKDCESTYQSKRS